MHINKEGEGRDSNLASTNSWQPA